MTWPMNGDMHAISVADLGGACSSQDPQQPRQIHREETGPKRRQDDHE